MKDIQIKEVLLALLVFIALSFLARIVSITIFGTILINLLPTQDHLSLQLALVIAILAAGLGTAKFMARRVHDNLFMHALLVAAIAGIYKAVWPDFVPLPFFLVGLFSVLNFSVILVGVRLAKA